MKLAMTIKDETAEMDVTAFDSHAELMTDLKLSLLSSREELSQERVPERVTNILHKKFTMFLGLSPQAIRDAVLTYRVYRAVRIIEEVPHVENPEAGNPAEVENRNLDGDDGPGASERILACQESLLSEKIDAVLQEEHESDGGSQTDDSSSDSEAHNKMEISPTKKQKRFVSYF